MRIWWYNFLMKTQESSVEKLTSIIEEKDRRIAELETQVEWFLSQLRLAKHKQYGASSEQTDLNQMSIFNEAESTADLNQPEPEITEVKTHYRRRTRLTTDKLPGIYLLRLLSMNFPKKVETARNAAVGCIQWVRKPVKRLKLFLRRL